MGVKLRRRPQPPPAAGRGVFDSISSRFLTISFMIVLMIHVDIRLCPSLKIFRSDIVYPGTQYMKQIY